MKVKCINAKNYALTVNNEYEVLNEIDQRYVIINDKNRQVKYGTDLFEKVEEEEAIPARPPDSVETIVGTARLNDERFTFTINETRLSFNHNLRISGTDMSCGIKEVYGLNDYMDAINHTLAGERQEVINELTKKFFSLFFGEMEYAMALLSTNTDDDDNDDVNDGYPVLQAALDPLATSITRCNNPNSDNVIALWVIKL
tara:strand:- start:63599 stop:64198 length:600 start_codon:yes stop_codon:yes gene_type:complete